MTRRWPWERKKTPEEEKKPEAKVEEKLKEKTSFSFDDEIKTYHEGIRPFLIKYGFWLRPDSYLGTIKRKLDIPPEQRGPNYTPVTDEENEVYIFAKGTEQEIKNHWEKKYANMTSEDINGIKVANALRDIYRKRIVSETKGKTDQISEAMALDIFPKLKEELYSPQ